MSTKANAFENPVIAALEVCAKRRWRAAETDSAKAEPDDIGRTVAIIDAAAEKIEGGDYGGVESALVAQALSLDVIFDQFVRRSAIGERLFHPPMQMAFRAQAQCRVTFKNLMALRNPRALQNSSRRTIENGKIPA
jgi:hypothetical protein